MSGCGSAILITGEMKAWRSSVTRSRCWIALRPTRARLPRCSPRRWTQQTSFCRRSTLWSGPASPPRRRWPRSSLKPPARRDAMPAGSANELKQAVLVGAGRMGAAMARGWLRGPGDAGLSLLHIVEPEPSEEVAAWKKAGRIALNDAANPVDVAVLAVKPQGFAKVAPGLAGWIGPRTLVVSIMAGVTIRGISEALGATKVARAMPNTPGAIGKGVTGYALSQDCGAAEKAATEQLLAPLGGVVGPLDESRIDAVTAVSGSGPAYVFLLAEALEGAAVSAGLDRGTAAQLARQTVIGAGA